MKTILVYEIYISCDYGTFLSNPLVEYCLRYKEVKFATFLCHPRVLLGMSLSFTSLLRPGMEVTEIILKKVSSCLVKVVGFFLDFFWGRGREAGVNCLLFSLSSIFYSWLFSLLVFDILNN